MIPRFSTQSNKTKRNNVTNEIKKMKKSKRPPRLSINANC